MGKPTVPQHKAALYFNELAPMQGQGQRCALFGHFYHLPDPDVTLTRPVVALPDGGWGVVNDNDVSEAVCGGLYFERDGKRELFASFRGGDTYVYQGTTRASFAKPPHVGFLSGLRMIGGVPYACGSQNAIFRFDGAAWVDLATPLRVTYSGPDDPILNSIDGFDERDIYAVGYNGSIVHFDGVVWRQIDSPTNQHLHQVLCHSDGRVYACGRSGSVLRGRLNQWDDLSSPERAEDFWGLAAFDGHVYLCTYRHLFRIAGDDLEEVAVAVNSAGTFYRLASNESFLWATTGTGRILRFDKRQWLELTWPDSA